MSEPRPVDKALEWLVYAPVGAGIVIKDMTPGFVTMFATRGRSELAKGRAGAEQKLKHYRQLGELVIAFGPGEVRRRVGTQFDQVLRGADGKWNRFLGRDDAPGPDDDAAEPTSATTASVPAPGPVATRPAPVSRAGGGGARSGTDRPGHVDLTAVPDAVGLPIPDYDALSASQVVDRLNGLSANELGSVRDYERTHRGRRTILGKIAQLTA